LEATPWRGLPLALGLSLLLAVACVTDSAPESSASAKPARASEPALDLVGDAPWPSEYAKDPLWVRASAGIDFDQARLARRESATSLLAAAAHGGSLGRAALAALAYASDRRGALGALCALVEKAAAASQGELIAALYDIVMNAPAIEDVLDPDADLRCSDLLKEAVRRDVRDAGDLDRARAVLARLPHSP
jgi:hypothetical protein